MSDKLFKLLGAADEGEALVIATETNATMRGLFAATGTKTLVELQTAVESMPTLVEEVKTLAAKVKAYETANLARDRDATIAKLSADGKLPPALHEWAKTQTIESLNTFGQSAPILAAPATPDGAKPPVDKPITLSQEEKEVCRQVGMSEEDFIEERRAELASDQPRRLMLDGKAKG